MDEKCSFCKVVIKEDETRFYVVFSSRESYRYAWEIILTLCPKCFAGHSFHEGKEK